MNHDEIDYSRLLNDHYEIERFIADGSSGHVYAGKRLIDGTPVALKKLHDAVRRQPQRSIFGFDSGSDSDSPVDDPDPQPLVHPSVLREIRLLRTLQHPNVLSASDVVADGNRQVYVVLEYASTDLSVVAAAHPEWLDAVQVRSVLSQLLKGLVYLHEEQQVVHRDLKPENVLAQRGEHGLTVKIGDLGSARRCSDDNDAKMSPDVTTLCYRAPEILLGSCKYTAAVDMWAIGCIFAFLVRKEVLLPGCGELDQILKMCELLGAPNVDVWPSLLDCPMAARIVFPQQPEPKLAQKFPPDVLEAAGFGLLASCICYDPVQRITASNALEHLYFI